MLIEEVDKFFLDSADLTRWKKWFQNSFLFLILLFLYLPLALFILLSFTSSSSKNNVSSYSFSGWTMDNYKKFFVDASFTGTMKESLFNSLMIAFISTPIALVIGLITAVSVWRNYGKGKKYVFGTCNLSIASPDIVQAIAFSLVFSFFILPLGFELGFFTIILSHIALAIPYVVIFLYPRLNKLNHNILFASYDLNCNFIEALVNVIVPTLLPNILGAGLLIFTISFDDFIVTNLIRGSVSTITSEIYTMKNGTKAWSFVLGSLMIIFVFMSIFITNFYRFIRRRFND